MAKRFYNPGVAFEEMMRFDHPTNDPKEQNLVSYWPFKAPEHEFFEVPTEIEFPGKDGEPIRIAVRFAERVQKDYAKYGVVLVDANPGRAYLGGLAAKNDKEARDIGDATWRESLFEIVREHERICLEVRNAGFKPQRAKGRFAYALKTLGIEDPAGDVADVVQRKQDTSEVDQLKAQLAQLQQTVTSLQKAK